jgi:hypothetical protein
MRAIASAPRGSPTTASSSATVTGAVLGAAAAAGATVVGAAVVTTESGAVSGHSNAGKRSATANSPAIATEAADIGGALDGAVPPAQPAAAIDSRASKAAAPPARDGGLWGNGMAET